MYGKEQLQMSKSNSGETITEKRAESRQGRLTNPKNVKREIFRECKYR